MTGPRLIGVLGGMGPEATIHFQLKLLKKVAARDDADHIPLLIDMNPQVPSRIAYLIENSGENPEAELARMARRLETAGAEALVMPCNTAHLFAAAITDAVRIPLLNIIDLVSDHAAELLGRDGRVGLLASPAMRDIRLYESALEQRGLTGIWPGSTDAMLRAIRIIKSGGDHEAASEELVKVSTELTEIGADLQVIGCTEFSIIAGCLAEDVRALDTLDLLASAAAEFSMTGKLG